jgi:hypothetical protein
MQSIVVAEAVNISETTEAINANAGYIEKKIQRDVFRGGNWSLSTEHKMKKEGGRRSHPFAHKWKSR